MISDADREKIAKLPVWARDLIKRLEIANEPLLDEVVKLRRENMTLAEKTRRLKDSNEALLEILAAAGRGGNKWAETIVSILEGYEIFRPVDGEGAANP